MGQSLAAVFYLPHLVAQELGAFRDEGLCVECVTSFGQQWSMLECGAVDIAIGGPTRNMALYLREGRRIVNFCAGLRANTWFLVARRSMANFHCAIATLLAPCFRGWTPPRLANAIAIYQRLGTWPCDALIPRADWERYCTMFVEAGALTRSVPYEDLVDARFGQAAGMQADEALFTPPPSQPLL